MHNCCLLFDWPFNAHTHAGWTGELYCVPLFSSGPAQGGALGKSFVHLSEGGPPMDSALMGIDRMVHLDPNQM